MKRMKKLISALLVVIMICSLIPAGALALTLPEDNAASSGDDARLMNIVPTGTVETGTDVTGTGVAIQIQGTGAALTLNAGAPAGSIAYLYGSFKSTAPDIPAITIGSGWTVYIGNTDTVTTQITAETSSGGKMYGVKVTGVSTVTIDSGNITATSINSGTPTYNDIAYGVYAEGGAVINIGSSAISAPATDYTTGPQIKTNGTSGNYGVTAVSSSTANIYQGCVSSQGVNATAVYIDGSAVNVTSNDTIGARRTSPVFLAEVGNLTSDVAMSVTNTTGAASWSVSGVGAVFSGYTAFSANCPSNTAGGGLAGGTFRGTGYAVSLSYGPVQSELKQNYYLRNDISGDYYSYSNGTRGVSASGYAVAGTVSVVDAEKELNYAMVGTNSTITDYTLPCNVVLTNGGLAVTTVRSLNMNGKNLEYDGTNTDYVLTVAAGHLTIRDRSAYQYTNISTSSGITPAGVIRLSSSGTAVKVTGGILTLGDPSAYGPMITGYYSAADDTGATVTGLLCSGGVVNMNSGSIYGTYSGVEVDSGEYNITAGTEKQEFSVISGKTHYGLSQFGGALTAAGGIISLDARTTAVSSTSSAYPWALYMKYGSGRQPNVVAGTTVLTGGYYYSIATDAIVNGRNQQLADLTGSTKSFADNQTVSLNSGVITKPKMYKVASPTVMRGSDNTASKGEYDNYLYYGYAIYNGMADSTSFEYNTATGLHAVSTRAFASYFTLADNKDYANTGVVNQKVCTCCGQTYTGTACPNCTNTRCSVCGKCPNHCTCKNTNLVTDDHFAYVSGYPDGTFRPTGTLTRAEASVIFYKLLQNKNYISSKYFSDVNHNDWYYTYVSCLASKGIISGYPDGCFHPNWKVTRAEFCVMAAKFYSLKSGTIHFADVPDTYWGYKYIVSAVSYGWINDGYGRFYPDQAMPRQEVVLFVNNMSSRVPDQYFIDANYGSLTSFRDVPRGSAYYYQIMEAANGHTYVQKSGVETWKALSK